MRDFVCGPENPDALGVRHFLAEDRVEGEWVVPPRVEGWAGLAHGTAFAALHDISAVWTTALLAEELGFTQRLDVRFLKPLRVGERVTTVGRVAEASPKAGTIATEVLNEAGAVASRATIEYAFVGDPALLARILGRPLSPFTAAFLRAPKGERRALLLARQAER